MRKILYATPLKGQLSSFYVKNLLDVCRRNFPDVDLQFSFLEGPDIHQARNEIVNHALRGKYDELIMCDKDLEADVSAVARLLYHESAPVVCALYCQRSLDTFWHVQGWSPDEKPDAVGLMRVSQCAIGFSKIRLEVFDQLAKDNPDRVGLITHAGEAAKLVRDFFPMELVGPNTPEARLAAVETILLDEVTAYTSDMRLSAVHHALTTKHTAYNLHTAEDYGFCRLCRESGIPVKVDTQLMVQHHSEVPLPVSTEQVVKMLHESWRQDDLQAMASTNGDSPSPVQSLHP